MNRLMIRHTMDKPLPYDAEVEYLESTGTQFIDTGILATSATSMECQFAFLDSQCPQFMCMGATHTGSCGFFNVGIYYNVGKLGAYMSADAREGVEVAYDTQYHTYYLSAAEQRIDNTITSYTSGQHFGYNSKSGVTREPISINLFGRNIDWTPDAIAYSYMTCRLKYVRIMNNGILVRDMIPVRKGNTGYLYDKVSGRLFGNQGTGSFVVGPDYNPFAYQYLTFVPLEDSTFSFSKRGTGNDIEYSIDGGAWTALASKANTPTVGAGHNIRWRAELTPSTTSGSRGIGTFSATGLYDACGNTMSLLYGDNYIGQTTLVGTYTFYMLWQEDSHIYRADRLILPATTLSNYCYQYMFRECTSLTTAPTLPATTLANSCYGYMFKECSSLTTAPTLPATTLARYCYTGMFSGVHLTTAPELPATTLANSCYREMFKECSSLTTAPTLPATTLAGSCYRSMFEDCTNLTTAPTLPATTLASYCYGYMFKECSSLTTAPELLALTLKDDCYSYMFYSCKISYIKMLATDISASNCLLNWLSGVSATGTFVKNAAMTTLPTGISGIPSGWTVIDDPSTINS